MQEKCLEVWRQCHLSSSSCSVRIWAMKASELAKASLRASLVDLESLKSSQRVILLGYWQVEPRRRNEKVLMIFPPCLFEELWYTTALSASPRVALWNAWLVS